MQFPLNWLKVELLMALSALPNSTKAVFSIDFCRSSWVENCRPNIEVLPIRCSPFLGIQQLYSSHQLLNTIAGRGDFFINLWKAPSHVNTGILCVPTGFHAVRFDSPFILMSFTTHQTKHLEISTARILYSADGDL